MRAQAIAIFLTVVISLIGVSYYQVGEGVANDAKSLGEAAARSQIAALVPAFAGEFKSINQHVKDVAPEVLGKATDFGDDISNRFEMIAKLDPNDGAWSIVSRAFHQKTKVKSWAEKYSQVALKSLRPRDIPLGGTALTALLDPQRRPFFLWIVRDEKNQWSSVITKTDVFQAILDRQRGQSASIFLVNRTGQALGHTTAEYVGTVLKDDPVVSEIMSTQKAQGVGQFRTAAGVELQGLYEQIPGSNVYVVLSRPWTASNQRIASVRMQILLMGAGLALLGLAVMMLTLRSDARASTTTTASGYVPSVLANPVALPSSPQPMATANTPMANHAVDVAREKMKAYTVSASALAREMHGPLTRILSQAQLLKAKSINSDEVMRIEELAREGRGVVLKLLAFAGEEDFRSEPTSLLEVINRVLVIFESQFQKKGIKLEKNLKRMPNVIAHPVAVMKVLESVLNNAIEAMERMPQKNLILSLETEGNFVVLKVKDSGEGIAADKMAQVMDPFFTTKNTSQHSGLGLSTAYGLLREFGGELQVTSQQGQGATVVMKFQLSPVQSAENMDAAKSASSQIINSAPKAPQGARPASAEDLPQRPLSAASSILAGGQPSIPVTPGAPVPPPPSFTASPSFAAPGVSATSAASQLSASQSSATSASPGRTNPPVAPAAMPAKPSKPPPVKVMMPEAPQMTALDLELSGELAPEADSFYSPTSEPVDSLIQEQAVNETLSMIDHIENAPLVPTDSASLKPSGPPAGLPESTGFGKIDKPTMKPKKPPARVAVASAVNIRKPGERK